MKNTINKIEKEFNILNELVFENKLPKIKLEVFVPKNNLEGYFQYNRQWEGLENKIVISENVDLQRVLLHEMCHYYLKITHLFSGHGKMFKDELRNRQSMLKELNKFMDANNY